MTKKVKLNLPKTIRVRVKKLRDGYFAELIDYDAFTEASGDYELIFNVNDLIFTYFDVPIKYRKGLYFLPPMTKRRNNVTFINNQAIQFNALLSPGIKPGTLNFK